MKAADVMVLNVVTVGPQTSVHELADIFLINRISAAPVVGENGHLVGVVSESDLLRRAETGTERRRSWWLKLLSGNQALVAECANSHGRKITEIMSPEVVTASPDMSLQDVAALLEKNRIRQVPIVSGGRMVGIVSRANLIQALATARRQVSAATATSDSMIREDLMSRLATKPWVRSSRINVIVHDGTVELWGAVPSRAEQQEIRILAEAAAGVRSVHDNLLYG